MNQKRSQNIKLKKFDAEKFWYDKDYSAIVPSKGR